MKVPKKTFYFILKKASLTLCWLQRAWHVIRHQVANTKQAVMSNVFHQCRSKNVSKTFSTRQGSKCWITKGPLITTGRNIPLYVVNLLLGYQWVRYNQVKSYTATDMMYLFTTVTHAYGHWQLQELLGNVFTARYKELTVREYKNSSLCRKFGSAEHCFFFQNKIKYFFGYFEPEKIFLDNENKWFSVWANRYFGKKITTAAEVHLTVSNSIGSTQNCSVCRRFVMREFVIAKYTWSN